VAPDRDTQKAKKLQLTIFWVQVFWWWQLQETMDGKRNPHLKKKHHLMRVRARQATFQQPSLLETWTIQMLEIGPVSMTA
jgi:hypothetical protein